MKARDTVTALIGLILGVIGTLSAKSCCPPTPPAPITDAAVDVAAETAAAEAAVGDDASQDASPSVVTAAATKPAPVCAPGCNAHPCKPGATLTCYGCGVNGSNQQVTGEQLCGRDQQWGACSAGPACSPFAIESGDLEALAVKDGGPKPTKCPTECKPGAKLVCFGCPLGGSQQTEGSRTCQKNGMWGSCSAGPGCQ